MTVIDNDVWQKTRPVVEGMWGPRTLAISKVGMQTRAIRRSPTDMLTINELVTVCRRWLTQKEATAKKLPKKTANSMRTMNIDIDQILRKPEEYVAFGLPSSIVQQADVVTMAKTRFSNVTLYQMALQKLHGDSA